MLYKSQCFTCGGVLHCPGLVKALHCLSILEGWLRGRRRSTRNRVGGKPPRGFESLPLRLRSPKRATADAVRKEIAKESKRAEASYGRHRRLRADQSPQVVREGDGCSCITFTYSSVWTGLPIQVVLVTLRPGSIDTGEVRCPQPRKDYRSN